MLDNKLDTPNTVFTPEETGKLTEAQRRLHVLENEITIATKNLQVTKREAEKAYKDKLYQDEQLDSVTKLLVSAQEKLAVAKKEQSDILSEIDKQRMELGLEINAALDERDELDVRKQKLSLEEENFRKEVETFNKERDEFLKEKSDLVKAKEILSSAIASLPWQK